MGSNSHCLLGSEFKSSRTSAIRKTFYYLLETAIIDAEKQDVIVFARIEVAFTCR